MSCSSRSLHIKTILVTVSAVFLVLFRFPIAVHADLYEGLVGYWSFDEGEGSIAYDHSGRGNDGTIYGATWDPNGISAQALSFDGDNDRVIIPDDDSFDIVGSITLAAWVKPTSSSSSVQHYIIDKRTSLDDGYYIMYRTLQDPKVFLLRYFNATIPSTTVPELANWYHIVGTFDSTTSMLNIYVNGVLENSTTRYDIIPVANTSPVMIGRRNNLVYYFKGMMDDIRIYKRALNGDEIKKLYEDTLCPAKDNLWNIKWFHCDSDDTTGFDLDRNGSPVCGTDNCNIAYCWRPLETRQNFTDALHPDQISGTTDSQGGLIIEYVQDVQVYGDTYLYVDSPRTLNAPIGGECKYNVWLNNFEVTSPSPVTLNLSEGWNHLEFTSYNQAHDGKIAFFIDYPFASHVEWMSSAIPNKSDVNCDEIVNFIDYTILTQYWQESTPAVDIAPEPYGDGMLNFLDIETFIQHWLELTIP